MIMLVDGKPVDTLAPKIARRLSVSPEHPLAEGVVMSTDQIIAVAARGLQRAIGVAGGVGAAIMIGVTVVGLINGSSEIAFMLPVVVVIVPAMGALVVFIYRWRMARVRDKAAWRSARMAPPGTTVRLDTAGLTVDERTTPWSDIAIDTMEIVTDRSSEGADDYHIEAILLDVQGRTVILDDCAMTNGHAIVDKALRDLHAPWA